MAGIQSASLCGPGGLYRGTYRGGEGGLLSYYSYYVGSPLAGD